MKNKLFSFKLYKEGMKQLRAISILGLLVALMFLFITQTASLGKRDALYDSIDATPSTISYEVELESMLTVPSIIPVFVSILLPLTLFGFLNKRSHADFYHSLPYTRSCMFLSYSASVLTWYLINFLTLIIVCIATVKLFYSHYTLLYDTNLIYTLLVMFIIGFMCQGAILIAKALTGNVFSNTLVTLLILIGPRLLTTIIIDTVSVLTTVVFVDLVPTTYLLPVLDGQYNLIIYYLFSPEYATDISLVHLIYSAVLGILYFAIALVLFKKRPSEAAGKTAINRPVLLGTLISIAVIIGAIATSILIPALMSKQGTSGAISGAIGLYVISFALLIVYQLTSTKKLNTLKKVIPALVITVVMDILVVLSIYGILGIHKNYTPNIKDGQAVLFSNAYPTSSSDFDLVVQNNDMVSGYVKKAYAYTIKKNLSYSDDIWETFHDNHYYCNTLVTVNDKEVYLNLLINEEDFKEFKTELLSSEEYLNNIRTVPEKIDDDKLLISSIYFSAILRDDELILYDSIYEEYNKLSDDDKIALNANGQKYQKMFFISIYTEDKKLYFNITPKCFPKTFEKIFDYAKTQNEEHYNDFYKTLSDDTSKLVVSITNLNTNEEKEFSHNDALGILKNVSKENFNYTASNNVYRIDIENYVTQDGVFKDLDYHLLICTDEPLF